MTVVLLILGVVLAVALNAGGGSSGRGSGTTRARTDRDTQDIVLYGAPVKRRDRT